MLRQTVLGTIVLAASLQTGLALHAHHIQLTSANAAPSQSILNRQPHSPLRTSVAPEFKPALDLRGGAGETSIKGLIISLVKNIVSSKHGFCVSYCEYLPDATQSGLTFSSQVGSGVMTLAAGVASFSDEPNAVIISTILCGVRPTLNISTTHAFFLFHGGTEYRDFQRQSESAIFMPSHF